MFDVIHNSVADQLGMVALHLDTDKLELANLALYRLQINRTETEVAPDVSISLSDTVNGKAMCDRYGIIAVVFCKYKNKYKRTV